ARCAHNLLNMLRGPVYADIPEMLADRRMAVSLVETISKMDHKPFGVITNRHSLVKQEKAANVILTQKVEVRNAVHTASGITIHVNPKRLAGEIFGRPKIAPHLISADKLSNPAPSVIARNAGKATNNLEHGFVGAPRHGLQMIHTINVG